LFSSLKKTFEKNIKSFLPTAEFLKISQGSATPLQKAFSLLQSYDFPTPGPGFFKQPSWQMQVKDLFLFETKVKSIEELLTHLNKIEIPEDDSFNAIKSFISLRLQPLETQQGAGLKADKANEAPSQSLKS